MGLKPDIEGISIVLVGAMNPQIFTPMWFAEYELVRKSEAEAAEIQIVHPEVAALKMGEFSIQIFRDRAHFTTTQPHLYAALRDLVFGTFQLLNHTPVTALGINYDAHFPRPADRSDRAVWSEHFVPLKPFDGLVKAPSLISTSVRGARPDDEPGFVGLKIEPSTRVVDGVYVNINDHFDLPEGTKRNGAKAVDLLQEHFPSSHERSTRIAAAVADGAWR